MNITEIENTLDTLEESIKDTRDRINVIKRNQLIVSTHSFTVVDVMPLDALVKKYIQYVLHHQCNGIQTECAKLLGVSRSTLWRHLSTEEVN